MGRREYDRDMYDKMYDVIELIYILNRLSNNSYVDESSKRYLIEMLGNAESIKSNFDKYRGGESYRKGTLNSLEKYDGSFSGNYGSFLDRIIFFLKTLND